MGFGRKTKNTHLADVIDVLEDDLAPHRVQCVEGGQRDTPSHVRGDACEEAMDVDLVLSKSVRWIDMTRGVEEEGEIHQKPEG